MRIAKAELETCPEPQVVPIERFLDGNDDLGSIGCNLLEHPSIPVFPDVLTGLLHRDDVEAVYAQIGELDPGDGCWPFTNTIYIVGTIPSDELRGILTPLQPDEIGLGEDFGMPASIKQAHTKPVLAAWWD